METQKIKEIVAQMTLEEKAAMCSGADFWHTKKCDRLGIPASMVSDGPHGLRKQNDEADHLGINESIKAVCFPAGCGTAASFNRKLVKTMGEALGNECLAEGVDVILGPAVNIKRSPLCGRNFEYYSEDPLVASEMATALIKGVQSKNIGTSIKHFLANNQETRRMSVDEHIDERTLNEIYLAAFEGAVKNAKPWTVMCSYNKINGIYAAENHEYLTKTLREKWGFDGYVMSDWGAVNNRVSDLKAGLDLEMPASNGTNDKLIVEAVRNGELDEKILDTAVERILNVVFRCSKNRKSDAIFDLEKDHELSAKIAEETIVLLKNDAILPLKEEDEIAFIGKYAKFPRYQGGGSSHINSYKIVGALEAAKEAGNSHILYAQGYDDKEDVEDEKLLKEAVDVAKKAKVAVIFAGLPDSFESEGFDRKHMSMPKCQNELIRKIALVQPNTVVVLHNGSPVEMPWIDNVKGIVEAYLSGEGVGTAEYNILFGRVNPSGKLPESFPKRLEDNPTFLAGFGEEDNVTYQEGIFVGYRYYEKKKIPVQFPFGFGLSYTTFAYNNLQLDKKIMNDTEVLKVSVDVTNTGTRVGKEVVQLYVSDVESTAIRPNKELKDFVKIELKPNETKTVTFSLGKRAFAYYNMSIHDWCVESGAFDILIGGSSADIELQERVMVESTEKIPFHYTTDTIMGDIMKRPKAFALVKSILGKSLFDSVDNEKPDRSNDSEAISSEMSDAMLYYMPLRGYVSFGNGISMKDINHLVDQLNLIENEQLS